MKRILFWVSIVSFIAFVILWGIIGLEIFNGNYDFVPAAYAEAVLLIILFASLLSYKLLDSRCPHCRKIRWIIGNYCYHCGKETSSAEEKT